MNAGQSVTRKSLNSSHKHPITTAVQAALRTGATAALLSMPVVALSQSNFSAVLELSDLDGSDGFVLNGIDVQDNSGDSLSRAGDINGDGVGDLIINPARADPNGIFTGESYVVFGGGSVGVAGVIELSALDGSDGFVLNGIDAFDFSGTAVSGAGDINGDGVGDLVIGARGAGPNGVDSGESYVVFGGGGIGVGGVVELSALDGSDGFFLNGIEVDDRSGRSVSGHRCL